MGREATRAAARVIRPPWRETPAPSEAAAAAVEETRARTTSRLWAAAVRAAEGWSGMAVRGQLDRGGGGATVRWAAAKAEASWMVAEVGLVDEVTVKAWSAAVVVAAAAAAAVRAAAEARAAAVAALEIAAEGLATEDLAATASVCT